MRREISRQATVHRPPITIGKLWEPEIQPVGKSNDIFLVKIPAQPFCLKYLQRTRKLPIIANIGITRISF